MNRSLNQSAVQDFTTTILCFRQVLNVIINSFLAQTNFICPEKDGLFEDTQQCDKYYDCFDGIPEERLCPDGLVFDPFSRKREPCDHYFNVDCGDRLELRKFYKISSQSF